MPPPPSEPGTHISALNQEAAPAQPWREAPRNVFQAQAFQLLAPWGFGWGSVALPFTLPGRTRPGAFPSWSPTPPHGALALHTNSPCVNVASIITDCHSSSGGGGLKRCPSGHGLGWPFLKTRQLGQGFSSLGLRERG